MNKRLKFEALVGLVVLVIVAILLLQGCGANQTKQAYTALSGSKMAYTSSFTVLGVLYKQGQITEEQKNKAIALGRLYMAVHNTAVEALAAYLEDDNAGTREAYLVALAASSKGMADFLEYYVKLKGDK